MKIIEISKIIKLIENNHKVCTGSLVARNLQQPVSKERLL
jgi:hypothetical protein